MNARTWRLVLLGPPGVGKGTQGRLLAQTFGVPQIGTGDTFRKAVEEGTPMGLAARPYMDAGALVPDDVTIGVVMERLAQPDAQSGFILDGFPRTAQQATALDALLLPKGLHLDGVIEIKVDPAEVVRRLTGRRLCVSCGTPYHLQSAQPHQESVCDRCGGRLAQRPDDDEKTVVKRLAEYQRKTAPLTEYYGGSGLLRVVDGNGDVTTVLNRILTALHVPVGRSA